MPYVLSHVYVFVGECCGLMLLAWCTGALQISAKSVVTSDGCARQSVLPAC